MRNPISKPWAAPVFRTRSCIAGPGPALAVTLAIAVALLVPGTSDAHDGADGSDPRPVAHHATRSDVDPVVADLAREAQALVATVEAHPGPLPMQLTYPFDTAQRTVVDFFPMLARSERPGLTYGLMPLEQRRAAHGVLRALLSDSGYLKVHAIRGLEDALRDGSSEFPLMRMSDAYRVQLFGAPAETATWGFKYEGHHLSVNATVADGQLRTTPLFLGANPAEVRTGPQAGVRVLGAHEDGVRRLLESLTAEQLEDALVEDWSERDGIQPGPLPDPPAPAGLSASRMTTAQRRELVAVIATFAHTFRHEVARAEMERVEAAGLDAVRFQWRGSTEPGKPHSVRIQGPSVLIEIDVIEDQPGAGANHVHAQWRDPARDFGRDLIGEHVARDHGGASKPSR